MVFGSGNPEENPKQNPGDAGGKLCLYFARLLHPASLRQDVSNPSQCMDALESVLFSPFETNDLR